MASDHQLFANGQAANQKVIEADYMRQMACTQGS